MINNTTNISSQKQSDVFDEHGIECKMYPSVRPTLYHSSTHTSLKSIQHAYINYILTGSTQAFDTPEYKSIVSGSIENGQISVGLPKHIFPNYEKDISSFPFLKQAVILENPSDAYISISRQKQGETVLFGIEQDLVDRIDDKNAGTGVTLQHENKPWFFLMNHKALGYHAATNNSEIIPWCMRSAIRILNRHMEKICIEGFERDGTLIVEGLLHKKNTFDKKNQVMIEKKDVNTSKGLLDALFIMISLYSASHLSQAFWLMNPNQAAKCMSLLKKEDTLTWGNVQQGIPLTLLGLPIYLSSFMPDETPIMLTCHEALQVFFKEYPASMRRQDGYKRIDLSFISFIQTVVTTHIEDLISSEKDMELKQRPLLCILTISDKKQQENN